MQIRHLLIASLVSVAACGGGSKKAPVEPAPTTTEPTPAPETAATPPVAEKAPPVEAPVPPPPPPKFALGEAKIVLKAAKKTEASADIALAADGTITGKSTSSVKKENKTFTAKLSAEGELTDDKGEVIARLGDDGKVETRHVSEEKQDGKTMKTESKYVEVGTLDDTGAFTIAKDGKKVTIDDKGKVAGIPGVTLTITSAPEQRKAAMFIVIAMFGSSKVVMDSSSAKAQAAPAPAKK